MPIITLDDVECPHCHELFDLRDIDTEDPTDLPVTCPECDEDFTGQYDVAARTLTLEPFEGDDEEEEDEDGLIIDVEAEDEDDPDDEG